MGESLNRAQIFKQTNRLLADSIQSDLVSEITQFVRTPKALSKELKT